MINTILTLATVTLAIPKVPPVYNGNLKYLIADLGPVIPCHPYFDSQTTWFDPFNPDEAYKSVRDILNGLSKVGFNAIRLPMWPYNNTIVGVVETGTINKVTTEYTRDQCNDMNVIIMQVIQKHTLSEPNDDNTTYFNDNYWYFKTYMSPAFAGK